MTILLLDDDEEFRTGLADHLREDGHEVREYAAPHHLPPLQELDQVAMVVTDFDMPVQNGIAFADAWHRRYPEVPVVLVTMFAAPEVDESVSRRGYLHLQRKPSAYRGLRQLISQLDQA